MTIRRILLLTAAFVLLSPLCALAFMEGGCGAGQCTDCHSLTKPEAEKLLAGGVDQVLDVKLAEMPGLWAVEVSKGENRFPVYIDFSKSFLVAGNLIRLADKENVTQEHQARLNRVDVDRIPLEDALLLGRKDAATQVIVFTDPQCPYCRKLHQELVEVVEQDPSIAFWIKLYPLKMHPEAYDISRSIVCARSLEMLEDSFAGRAVPPPLCDTSAVDETLALVKDLRIQSTPTLVLPDGIVLPGFKTAEELLRRLGSKALATQAK